MAGTPSIVESISPSDCFPRCDSPCEDTPADVGTELAERRISESILEVKMLSEMREEGGD